MLDKTTEVLLTKDLKNLEVNRVINPNCSLAEPLHTIDFHNKLAPNGDAGKEALRQFQDAFNNRDLVDSTQVIDIISDKMADKISESMRSLAHAQGDIAGMVSDFDSRVATELQMTGKTTKLLEIESSKENVEFSFIDFTYDVINAVGDISYLIKDVNAKYNVKSADVANSFTANQAINNAILKLEKDIQEASINSLDIVGIRAVANDIPVSDIVDTLGIMMSKSKMTSFINELKYSLKSTKKFEGVLRMDTVLTTKLATLNVIQRIVLDGAEISFPVEGLKAKLEQLKELKLAIAYYICSKFNNELLNVLVLPNGVLVKGEYDKLIAQGLTAKDVARYIIVNQGGKYAPGGSLTPHIISSKERTDELYEVRVNAMIDKATLERKNAEVKVIKNIANEYLLDNKDSLSAGVNAASHVGNLVSDISKGVSLQDSLYNFLIKVRYNESFVDTLYHSMGSGYLKVLSNRQKLDDEAIKAIDGTVIAELVTKYLVAKFTVPTKKK